MKTKSDAPAQEEAKPIPMPISDVAVWGEEERLGRYGSDWPMTGRTPEEVREAAKALPAPVRDTDDDGPPEGGPSKGTREKPTPSSSSSADG